MRRTEPDSHDSNCHRRRPRHRAAGLREFFSEQVDLTVIAEAANGREALDIVRKGQVDVIVMDLSMPDQSGVDALAAIKARAPDLPVLILSGFPEAHYATDAAAPGRERLPEQGLRSARRSSRRSAPSTAAASTSPPASPSCWPKVWRRPATSRCTSSCPSASSRYSCGSPRARRSATWPTACRSA